MTINYTSFPLPLISILIMVFNSFLSKMAYIVQEKEKVLV